MDKPSSTEQQHTQTKATWQAHHAQITHTPTTRLLHAAAPRLPFLLGGEPAARGPRKHTWCGRSGQPEGPAPGGGEDGDPQLVRHGQGAQADPKGLWGRAEEDVSALQGKTDRDERKFQPDDEGNQAIHLVYCALSSYRWDICYTGRHQEDP